MIKSLPLRDNSLRGPICQLDISKGCVARCTKWVLFGKWV